MLANGEGQGRRSNSRSQEENVAKLVSCFLVLTKIQWGHYNEGAKYTQGRKDL